MKWFILLVGIVVLCFAVALMLGWAGGAVGLGRATSSLSHEPLPEGELHDADIDELRFDVTFRGYRMSQVDGVLERLRRELREKDEQIAFLRAGSEPVAETVAEPVAEPVAGTVAEPLSAPERAEHHDAPQA